MSRYLIILTPTDRFFFGGDMTFTVNENETEFTSYIIKSNKFPQQTSLLGMLRFLLLSNDDTAFNKADQKINCQKTAVELIGERSFNPKHNNSFGKIENLYPCFLQKKCGSNWNNIQIAPADYGMNVNFENAKPALINDQSIEIPEMNYDAKEYVEPVYICAGNCEIKESEIFQEDIRNGINRDITTGLVQENALFKQVFYRLKKGYRFAFEADITELNITAYSGQLVQLGADSSMFIIGIEEQKAINDNKEKQEAIKGNKVVLSSPAFIKKEDLKSVRFAISKTIPFKCIQTNVGTTSYNRNENEDHSDKYNLYDTGSVFYFKSNEDCNNFVKILKQKENFCTIGYNRYKVTNQ